MKDQEIELLQRPVKKDDNSQYFNINEYARSRILFDMLKKVRAKCKESSEYVILVLDDYCTKLISNFCTMFDLMEAGNIYQTELLSKFRKRYPMSDAIYFVQPSQQSINKIISDFPEEDKLDYDQYGSVHLCFLTPVHEQFIQKLAKYPKLVNKVKTFVEVNLDFTVWQDNIFKISTKSNQLMSLINPDKTSEFVVEQLSQKIYTLCSVMNERPYIQYQGDSILCEEVAMNVFKKLEYLYNYSNEAQNSEQIQCREPRGTLVIMDRTFDLVTPMIHDYNYQSCVFDYLDVPEDGSLDVVIPPQHSKNQRQAASENSHKLSEKDSVWQKYKSMHIAEVLGYLNDEIRALKQDQANLKKISDKEELDHGDIQNILKTIPEFEKRKAEVLIHLDLAQKITDKMQNPEYNIMKLIEFEQTVMSGVNDQFNPITENKIAKELTSLLKTLGRKNDIIRLLCIYLLCYTLPDSDFKTVSKFVETKEERDVLKLIRSYNKGEPSKKPTRSIPQISNEDFRVYQNRYKEIQEMYDILRVQPQIVKIAKDALNKDLDSKAFPFLGDEQLIQKSARGVNWHKNSETDEGRVILVVIGGISHYEICSVQNLEKQLGSSRLVIGSTQVITANDFIENLVPQKKKKRIEVEEDSANEDFDQVQDHMRQKRNKANQRKKSEELDSKRSNMNQKKSKTTIEDDEDGVDSDKYKYKQDQDVMIDIDEIDVEEQNGKNKKKPKKKPSKRKVSSDNDSDDDEAKNNKSKSRKGGDSKNQSKNASKRVIRDDSDEDDEEAGKSKKKQAEKKKGKKYVQDSDDDDDEDDRKKNKKKASKKKNQESDDGFEDVNVDDSDQEKGKKKKKTFKKK